MFKSFLIVSLFVVTIQADSFWDSATEKTSSLWDSATKTTSTLWDKTKDVGAKTLDKTKAITSDTWETTKKYSHKSKNLVLEQTIINGINALVDTTKIKVESFDIDDDTNKITMKLFLKGEDKQLEILIDDFVWSVTKDKKYIVIYNIKKDLNIAWIEYLLDDMIKRDGGNLVLPYKASTYSLLYAIKDDVEFNKELKLYENFDFVNYPYDKNYVDIKYFIVKDGEISVNVVLKDSVKPFICVISSYQFRTANHKQLIALRNIQFERCTKPWIQSIIEKQGNEVQFIYSDKLYGLFAK